MAGPFISVVIPAYNIENRIGKVVRSLMDQSYNGRYEVIVVDNNSTDNTASVAEKNGAKVIQESQQGPYAARNTGITQSNGEIIALLDATCCPEKEWLEGAVNCFESSQSDLIGGKIKFDLPDNPSAAELFDSLNNVQNQYNIKERGVAKTGNLFVKKEVFNTVGLFRTELRSGGDIWWTSKATNYGFSLNFCSDAQVYYPPRNLKGLIKKQYRVGKGKSKISIMSDSKLRTILFDWFVRIPKKGINTLSGEDQSEEKNNRELRFDVRLKLVLVGVITLLAQIFGSIVQYVQLKTGLDEPF